MHSSGQIDLISVYGDILRILIADDHHTGLNLLEKTLPLTDLADGVNKALQRKAKEMAIPQF